MDVTTFLRWTEMDRTRLPEFLERAARFPTDMEGLEPRRHPGVPVVPLRRLRPRRLVSLDATLARRRSAVRLGAAAADPDALSRLHQFAHGVTGAHGRGPSPSAGGLQGVELYEVHWAAGGPLPPGLYHYDREGHHLSRLAEGATRTDWEERVPSLRNFEGGGWLWVLAGDGARVSAKYGERGLRFLLLEAGHLMQNLCLLSASLGLATVPLGGFFEREIARAFGLPATDGVLYVGVCGAAAIA
jgi:SagB-type dehydrogenase family enzyme